MRPGEGKQPFGLHFLHDRLPFDMLVAWIGDLATRDLTRDKWAVQFHTKPFAKFTVIRHCTPDPRNRHLEFDSLLDTVIHNTQPPGCILAQPDTKCNSLVARRPTSQRLKLLHDAIRANAFPLLRRKEGMSTWYNSRRVHGVARANFLRYTPKSPILPPPDNNISFSRPLGLAASMLDSCH